MDSLAGKLRSQGIQYVKDVGHGQLGILQESISELMKVRDRVGWELQRMEEIRKRVSKTDKGNMDFWAE